nr:NAC domain-containing protein 72-like [Tanacetum cinerariifolium]
MVLMVERNRGEHLIRRFAGRGNEPDPRDVKIASLKQRIQELEFSQLQQNSPTKEAETESNETESEPIIWDIGDEEEEYPFVNKYLNFQEEPIMSVEEESCPVYDADNKEEESMPVYDTDIEEVIEEEDGDEKEVVYDDYEEASVFDDDQYEEEIVSEDFGRGFDEELMVQYLCRKVAGNDFPIQIIGDVDLYKFDPWDLPSKAMFGEKEWMAKIAVGEGINMLVFGVKGVDLGAEEAPYWTTLGKRESYKPRLRLDGVGAQNPYYARKDFLDCHLPREWEITKDAE